jgi:hypothetical protein
MTQKIILLFLPIFLFCQLIQMSASAQSAPRSGPGGDSQSMRSSRSMKSPQASSSEKSETSSQITSIPSTGTPKIEFHEVAFDFGKQIAPTELKHSFIFFNKGNSTLRIDNVKGG